ncbi:MAG: poly-gamma-glutamate system protein [Planctomycetota bacterium]|nr:poly-gamma-glutamate system protein [Planctomycetota bacterium]
MKWSPTRSSKVTMMFLTILSLGALVVCEAVKHKQTQPHLDEKLAAATKMQQAIDIISQTRAAESYGFDPETDPRRTGLIGQEFTPITSDRGTLKAKQVVTNPNFAALVVQMFKSAKLKKGDTVAVAWTGSLPGANLAVLSAIETLELKPIIITSVAASIHGANDPYMTWLDIERLLVDHGVFTAQSVAASYGAGEDTGKGLGQTGRSLIRLAVQRAGITFIDKGKFSRQVAERMKIYTQHAQGAPIKLYVNVGGGLGSLGARINGYLARPGFNRSLQKERFGRNGTMTIMAKKGVPVVHINYIDRLCKRYKIPFDPAEDVTPGRGAMFRRLTYRLDLVAGILVGLLITFFITIRIDVRHYTRRRRDAWEKRTSTLFAKS